MQLLWTREPANAPSSDDERIGAEIFGNNDFLVCIYDDVAKDEAASIARGRPVYRDAVMIAVKVLGEHDFMPHPLTQAEALRFPRAYRAYQSRRVGPSHIDVALLPGIALAQVRALHDMGLGNITDLAKANTMDDELEPFRQAAVKFAKPRFRVIDGQLKEVAA